MKNRLLFNHSVILSIFVNIPLLSNKWTLSFILAVFTVLQFFINKHACKCFVSLFIFLSNLRTSCNPLVGKHFLNANYGITEVNPSTRKLYTLYIKMTSSSLSHFHTRGLTSAYSHDTQEIQFLCLYLMDGAKCHTLTLLLNEVEGNSFTGQK